MEGMAFTSNHPYWVKSEVLDARWIHSTDPYVIDQTPSGYRIFESNATHKTTQSPAERKRQKIEYTQNRITARLMADYYKDDVLLMPEIDHPDKDIRYTWEFLNRGYKTPNLDKLKVPDSFLLNKKLFYEVKSYKDNYSYNKLKRMAKNGSGQAGVNVFFINQDLPYERIKNDLENYIDSLKKKQERIQCNGCVCRY